MLYSNFSKKELIPLKKFIWDGPSNQPNILNRIYELRLYGYEQDVENASTESKKATNVFKKYHAPSADSFSTTMRA